MGDASGIENASLFRSRLEVEERVGDRVPDIDDPPSDLPAEVLLRIRRGLKQVLGVSDAVALDGRPGDGGLKPVAWAAQQVPGLTDDPVNRDDNRSVPRGPQADVPVHERVLRMHDLRLQLLESSAESAPPAAV